MAEQFRWEDVKGLFERALLLETGQRDTWLRNACQGAPELLAEVQSLLQWHRQSTEFLETPAVRVADLPLAVAPLHAASLLGHSLGAWRIVDIIGRGGMGVVYLAERGDDAFSRQAAIKVVRSGANAAHIVDRFRRERQTLAALDHPNIARLMDGGTTPSGEPYFVMEFVDGVPVDRYCDDHALTVDQRLALFRQICAGVQYAHENLVVHRDIKPDNILVARDGTPKLLDFGVAKVISRDAAVAVAVADDRAVPAVTWLMTPDYASPEQVAGRNITTASDVYSLGVLLHVLLTGARPYQLTGTTPADIEAQLQSTTLIRPSIRVLGVGAVGEGKGAADVQARATRRGTTPRGLSKRLAGDLDAIVACALGRELSGRYSTVERLTHDLECHRTSRPIGARSRDMRYVASRFVQRHRLAFGVAASVFLLVVAGVAAVLWQARAAAEARARAERRFEEVRRLARTSLFDVHDAMVNVPGTTATRAMMVRTTVQYLEGLAREASGDASLQRELASAFLRVGDAQGPSIATNVGDTAGAFASYRRAIAIAAEVLQHAPDDIETKRNLAMAHRRLADTLAFSGDSAKALPHCEQSRGLFDEIAARRDPPLEDRVQAGVARIKLGDLLGNETFPNLGRPAEARRHYDDGLSAFRRLDTEVPNNARVRRYVGLTLERIGQLHETAREWPEAMAAYQESFRIREALAAQEPAHMEIQRDLGVAYEKLGNIQRLTGHTTEAVATYRRALPQFERLAQADPIAAGAARTVAIGREKLAAALLDVPLTGEAIGLTRTALATHRALAARDPGNAQARCDTARVAEHLADLLQRQAPTAQPSDVSPAVCTLWNESLTTRQSLRADTRAACASDDMIARLTAKLRPCR
jgi:serine/threonine protein kinase/tetratricopeptide (TPR) repeat protein